jgi:hypothetical protein
MIVLKERKRWKSVFAGRAVAIGRNDKKHR